MDPESRVHTVSLLSQVYEGGPQILSLQLRLETGLKGVHINADYLRMQCMNLKNMLTICIVIESKVMGTLRNRS